MATKTNATVKAINGSPLAKLTPARKLALPALRSAVIASGRAYGNAVSAFRATVTATPSVELFDACSWTIRVGGMVAALLNGGSNLDEMVLIAHCDAAIKARQTKGEKHVAMSPVDEKAYSSAKAKLSNLCRDAGVQNPSNNAKTVETRAPGGKPAKAAKTGKKAPAAKVPTITNDNELRAYVAQQRVAMLATVARASQSKKILNETTTIIQEAMTLLAKLAPQG